MVLTQVVIILILVSVKSIFQCSAQLTTNDEQKCAGQVCLPSNYSRLIGPYNESSSIDIKIDLWIRQILEVNDKLFTVSFTMFFGVVWQDHRILSLATDNSNAYVPIALSFMDHLWVPDVYFYDLKSIQTQNIISEFAGLWVINQTTVRYSQETQVTFWCPMRFEKYPFDRQVCRFQVGSYGQGDTIMKFSHRTLFYDQSVKNTILDYSVEIVHLDEKDKTVVWEGMFNFSVSGFKMRLERNILKYVITYYLPSGLFVIVSWASFLIPPEIVPGRMTLLVTLFLVLINISNSITANSPNTETITAISIWMITCMLFVFGALTSYGGILFHKYKASSRTSDMFNETVNTKDVKLKHIDNVLLCLFPLLFLLFNVVYWPILLS